jgi:hypothetical protein
MRASEKVVCSHGRSRVLKGCWGHICRRMKDSDDLIMGYRGLVRILFVHPHWALLRQTEGKIIAWEKVNETRGQSGKDLLCVHQNFWKRRPERSRNEPGAKTTDTWHIAARQGISDLNRQQEIQSRVCILEPQYSPLLVGRQTLSGFHIS